VVGCQVCTQHKYDQVFILKPWEAIYTQDNERYESFEQALDIHEFLVKTYAEYGYTCIDIPFGTVESRIDFIENYLTPNA
jgi:predicted ATPase